MGRKKKTAVPVVPKPNDDWSVETEIQINNRSVIPGTELKISKERGRFRFIKRVTTPNTSWVDVWGGPKGAESMRSFRAERIKTVHSKNQTTENLALEYRAKQKKKKEEVNS